MKRPWWNWLMVAVVAVVGFGVAKNAIAQGAISGGVKLMTGLGLDIGSMDVGVLRSAIGIKNLRLRNPSGFPDQYMVELPEIYVDYDLPAFFKGQVHLEEVRLHLAQFTVEKLADGRVNLNSLKTIQASKPGQAPPAEKPSGKTPQIAIDRLELKVGKVIYKDYTGGSAPKVQEFAVNLDEHYEHINNPQMLAGLIISRALMHTTVAKLTNINLTAIQSQVNAQLKQAAQAATAAAKQLQTQATAAAAGAQAVATKTAAAGKEAAGQAVGVAKGAAGSAVGAAKEAAGTLKKVIPFGQQ